MAKKKSLITGFERRYGFKPAKIGPSVGGTDHLPKRLRERVEKRLRAMEEVRRKLRAIKEVG